MLKIVVYYKFVIMPLNSHLIIFSLLATFFT